MEYALALQEKIRLQLVQRIDCVKSLNRAIEYERADKRVRQSYKLKPEDFSRVGELLVDSSVLDAEQVNFALILSERRSQRIGEVLVSHGLLSNGQLNTAIDLQRLLRCGLISRWHAVAVMQKNETPEGLLSSLEKVRTQDVERRLEERDRLVAIEARMDSKLRRTSRRLCNDIINGSLSFEQALFILNMCSTEDCSVPEAIARTNWTLDVRPAYAPIVNIRIAQVLSGWLTAPRMQAIQSAQCVSVS
jgi:hypothetical protein